MSDLNRVTLSGRLTSDPELRYTQTGLARARFSIAVNRRWRDRSQRLQEETIFVPIVVWGQQAETCANFLSKGRRVAVDGRLRLATFSTDEGERRKVAEVVATTVHFLDARPAEEPAAAVEPEETGPELAAEAGPEAEGVEPQAQVTEPGPPVDEGEEEVPF